MIGLKGCHEFNVAPLIYIDQLPGISVKAFDSVADTDKVTYLGVFEAITERAAARIEMDLLGGANIEFANVMIDGCIGRLKEPLTFVPRGTYGEYRGVVFQFEQSKYLVLNINKINFRSDIAQTVNFFAKDLFTGDILFTKTVDLIVGENEIPINEEVFPRRSSNKVFFGYDASESGYYDTSNLDCFDNCCSTCASVSCSSCSFISGSNAIQFQPTTFGLSISYSINCSMNRFLCENINVFKTAMLYAVGVEYLVEALASPRINAFTTTNKEANEKVYNLFEKRYQKALEVSIKSLNFCDNCCFDCKGGIHYDYINP